MPAAIVVHNLHIKKRSYQMYTIGVHINVVLKNMKDSTKIQKAT